MSASHKPPDKTNALPCERLGFNYAELKQRLKEAAVQCGGEIHSIVSETGGTSQDRERKAGFSVALQVRVETEGQHGGDPLRWKTHRKT